VTAVTDVVLVEAVDDGVEDVVTTVEVEVGLATVLVVVEFRPAEKTEQRARPTWAAMPRSEALQLLTRQGVTAVWMAGWPVPGNGEVSRCLIKVEDGFRKIELLSLEQ